MAGSFHSTLDQFSGSVRPLDRDDPKFLTRKVVIINKKLFKLTAEFVSKVADLFNVGPAVILLFNGDEPIVTFFFPYYPALPQ